MDLKNLSKKYSNGEITILWQPNLCTHSGFCVRGLPLVFNTKKHPWVQPEHATTEQLTSQIKKCPSGALSIIDEV